MSGNTVRLSKTDWVQGAFEVLAGKGIDQVKVSPLANKLKVTKGSFYWHFKDRQALLDAMLDLWYQQKTLDVIALVDANDTEPAARLLTLMHSSIMARTDNILEAAIRSWARSDAAVNKKLGQIDTERIDYVTSLLVQMGFDQRTALSRARVVCFSHAGVFWVGKTMTKAQLLDFVQDLYVMTITR